MRMKRGLGRGEREVVERWDRMMLTRVVCSVYVCMYVCACMCVRGV